MTSALPHSARNNTMTTWRETNHDREADRIYRERLFDPTLEAPFLGMSVISGSWCQWAAY